MMSPDGKSVWHASIRIGDSVVFVADESPMGYIVAPSPAHRPTAALQLYVKDCDAWVARAIEAGATSSMAVDDMFWGDRMGAVVDPFGVYWMIATRKHNFTEKELARSTAAFLERVAASQPAAPAEAAPPQPPRSDSSGGGAGQMS